MHISVHWILCSPSQVASSSITVSSPIFSLWIYLCICVHTHTDTHIYTQTGMHQCKPTSLSTHVFSHSHSHIHEPYLFLASEYLLHEYTLTWIYLDIFKLFCLDGELDYFTIHSYAQCCCNTSPFNP